VQAKNAGLRIDRFADWNLIFPRGGRPNFRKPLSRYQQEKIIEAHKLFIHYGSGGMFSPIRKYKKGGKRDQAQKALGQPPFFKGIFFNGGEKAKVGKLTSSGLYVTGPSGQEYLIDTFERNFGQQGADSPEQLKYWLRLMLKNNLPDNHDIALYNETSYFNSTGTTDEDIEDFIDEAAKTYARYESLEGGVRVRERVRRGKVVKENDKYFHPKEWMLGAVYLKRG